MYIQISMKNLGFVLSCILLSLFLSQVCQKMVFTELDALLYDILVMLPFIAVFISMMIKNKPVLEFNPIPGVVNAT